MSREDPLNRRNLRATVSHRANHFSRGRSQGFRFRSQIKIIPIDDKFETADIIPKTQTRKSSTKIESIIKQTYRAFFLYFRKVSRRSGRPLVNFFSPVTRPIYKLLQKPAIKTSSILRKVGHKIGRRRLRYIGYSTIFVFLAIVVVGSISLLHNLEARSYQLSGSLQNLVGKSDNKLLSQLTYDAKTKTFYLSKSAISTSSSSVPGLPPTSNSVTVGSSSTSKPLFSLKLPTDYHQGVTTYDDNSKLSFTMVPEFSTRSGKRVLGHIVYPLGLSGPKDIYTIKGNGLQEDLVYTKAPSSGTVKLSYKLLLPSTLQARMMSSGNLGVYSANPYLFGNISYGTSADASKVQKAREKSVKDNLVFVLPAPQIITPGGIVSSSSSSAVKLSLSRNIITIAATGLKSIHGLFSIDPSVLVASASNFQTGGNNESDITFDGSNNQITEAGLTGGMVNAPTDKTTTSTGALSTSYFGLGSVAYNGFLYAIGTDGTVQFAALSSSTGALSAPTNCAAFETSNTIWCAANTYTTGRQGFGVAVYNGYLYIVGGTTSGGTIETDVQYALLCNGTSNQGEGGCGSVAGTLGTWSTDSTSAATGSFSTGTYVVSLVAYKDYLYLNVGGTIDYAVITANGGLLYPNPACSLATWCATTSEATTLYNTSMVEYNGYLYVVGGSTATGFETSGTSNMDDIYEYAPINSNGTVGGWTTGTLDVFSGGSTTNEYLAADSAVAYDGNMYIVGGCLGAQTTSPCSGLTADDFYAPINSNGSLGTLGLTSSITTARDDAAVAAYGGYLYTVGGCSSASAHLTGAPTCTTSKADTQYSQIDSTGTIGYPWDGASSLPVATYLATAVAYNGYLYEIGGYSGSSITAQVDYTVLNSNGSMSAPTCSVGTVSGVWCESSATPGTNFALPLATEDAGSAVYNGYLYEAGGLTSAATAEVEYTLINSNGSLSPPSCSVGTISGDWCKSSTTAGTDFALPVAVEVPTSAAYDGYLYDAGGSASGNTAQVNYTVINSNGSLSAPTCSIGTITGVWCTSSTTPATNFALPAATSGATAVAYNGYLYFIGGDTSSVTAQVDYTIISSSGALSTPACSVGTISGVWCTSSTTPATNFALPVTTEDSASAVYNGYLYESGGFTGSFSTAQVDYTLLNSNGSMSAPTCSVGTISGVWCASSTTAGTNFALPAAEDGGASAAYNGYLYETGGNINGTLSANVYSAPMNNGGPGTTSTPTDNTSSTTVFNAARAYLGAVAYNGYLYIMGGNDNGTYEDDVQFTQLSSSGALTVPSYCAGGTVGTAAGDITVSGGVWCETQAFTSSTPREGMTVVAYNGHIYVLGGLSSSSSGGCTSGGQYCDDILYDSINSNGSLGGTWTDDTSSTTIFNTPRAFFGAAVYNDYLYIVGGNDNGTYLNDVQFTQLSSNGALAAPTASTYCSAGFGTAPGDLTVSGGVWCEANTITTARQGLAAIAYNGYLYIMGGQASTSTGACKAAYNYCNDVQSAPLDPTGYLDTSWNNVTYLNTPRAFFSAVAYNGYLYVMGGVSTVTYTAAGSSSWVAPSTESVSVELWGGGAGGGGHSNGTSGGAGGGGGGAYTKSSYSVTGGTSYTVTAGAGGAGGAAGSNADGGAGGVSWFSSTSIEAGGGTAVGSGGNGGSAGVGGTVTGSPTTGNVGGSGLAGVNGGGRSGSGGGGAAQGSVGGLGGTVTGGTGGAIGTGSQAGGSGGNAIPAAGNANGNPGNTPGGGGSGGERTTGSGNPGGNGGAGQVTITYDDNDVQLAPMTNNGGIGVWANSTSLTSPARIGLAAVAYNGNLYIMGGLANASSGGCTATADYCNDIQYTGLQSAPRVGDYSRLIDFTGRTGDDPKPIELLTNGGDCSPGSCVNNNTISTNPGLGGISGPGGIIVNYQFATNTCLTLNSSTTLPTGSSFLGVPEPLGFTTDGCMGSTSFGRYMWITYLLDDSQTATFPDALGNRTSVNGFIVYYHPAPGSRLRGGSTFSNGSVQSLDAPP